MTFGWFLWYGYKIGLSRTDILDIPFGELLDLIAVEQIKHEGRKLKKNAVRENEEFLELLGWG